MRYERKYKIESFSPEVVRQVVTNHPASFRKIFPDRQINNIYFDTANLVAYNENVDGIADRRKFRVRWYGTDIFKIEQPKLEVKIKHNMLGKKEVHSIPTFDLGDLRNLSEQVSAHSQMKLALRPTLVNSYQRSYFGTSNGAFRMTIDWDLQYFSLLSANRFTRYNLKDESTVLEIKYEAEQEAIADAILQHIPFRFSKSSKYVTGMNLTVG